MAENTDRELLELAAKAAGIAVERWHGDGGDIWQGEPREAGREAIGTWIRWNPLRSDGDALRLATQLELCVMTANSGTPRGYSCAETFTDDKGWTEMHRAHNADPYAATRRAIVRAAAEIGKQAEA